MADNNNSDDQFRTGIAMKIIGWGSLVIGIIGITIVVAGLVISKTDKELGLPLINDVFHSLLPVVAAWIGTVLAFYFGRENFESANRQVNSLIRKLSPDVFKEIPVKQVMIDLATMVKFSPSADGDIKLGDLTACFTTNTEKSRLPILSKENKPLFIMHRDEYNTLLTADPANAGKALKDFSSYGYQESKGFVLLKESATLNEALAALQSHPNCADVFITLNGSLNEALSGWLTNSRILSFIDPQES